jgi:histidyl-tRNA synthetase
MGVSEDYYRVDLSIARGLDYYTGTVYETNLIGYESLGSICSGGRYEDLAEVFTGRKLPGVGISIGLTRLLSQLFAEKILLPERASPTVALFIAMGEVAQSKALELAQELRQAGLAVDNYLENKKIGKQFEYADKLGIPYCLVLGENELNNKSVQMKNLKIGTQKTVAWDNLAKELSNGLTE